MKEIEIGRIGYRRRILTLDKRDRSGLGQPLPMRKLSFVEKLRVLFGARLVLRFKHPFSGETHGQ